MSRFLRIFVFCGLFVFGVQSFAGTGMPLKVGDRAPDFDLSVLADQGKPVQDFILSDYVGHKAKHHTRLVVVDFFALWCKPCKKIAPRLEKISKEFKDKGVVVVSILLEGGDKKSMPPIAGVEAKLRAFRKKSGLHYHMLYDPVFRSHEMVGARYVGDAQAALPSIFLVDSTGRIRAILQGARIDLRAAVVQALKGK